MTRFIDFESIFIINWADVMKESIAKFNRIDFEVAFSTKWAKT